jgi:hypothetical protein
MSNRRPVLDCAHVLILVLVTAALPRLGEAQEISVEAGRHTVEKGESLRVDLHIRSESADLERLSIQPVLPLGFTVQLPELPTRLPAGSSVMLPFVIQAPTQLHDLSLHVRGVSTADDKIVGFNVGFTDGASGKLRAQAVQFEFTYTTSMQLYLMWGLFGVIIAHLLKAVGKARGELRSPDITLSRAARFVLVEQSLSGVTIIVIGFAVLVMLARETVPVRGWPEALTLGLTLGVLGDEQLLAKFRSG